MLADTSEEQKMWIQRLDRKIKKKGYKSATSGCSLLLICMCLSLFVVASKYGDLVFLAVQENLRVIQLSSASQVSIHLRATCGSPSQQHCLPEVNLPNNLHSAATLQLCHAELATLRQDWAVPSLPLSLQTNAVVKQYIHCTVNTILYRPTSFMFDLSRCTLSSLSSYCRCTLVNAAPVCCFSFVFLF